MIGPWIKQAERGERCTCCDRPLKGKVQMLELDQRDNTYHDRWDVPEDHSQGAFPFGMACARKINGKENRQH